MNASRVFRFLGFILIANCVWVAIARAWEGKAAELLWLSHVGTLLAGLGLALTLDYVTSMALVSLFVFHGVWIVDGVTWWITGHFPIGVCYFLADNTWFQFSATVHHFYVLPLLLVWLFWRRWLHPRAWVGAGALFAVLVLISALFLPPSLNVNSAYAVWPGLNGTFLGYADRLPRPLYVLVLILAATFVDFWPVNRVLGGLVGLVSRERAEASGHRPTN